MKSYINPQFKNAFFYFMIWADAVLFILAVLIAYLFRFEFALSPENISQIKYLVVWMIPLKVFIFLISGIYRGMWRYTSLNDFWLLARASFIASLVIISLILYMNRFEGYSRAVFIIDGVLTFMFTGAARIIVRTYYSARIHPMKLPKTADRTDLRKVLIVGAGDAGEKILREIRENYELDYQVVGFIDDDPAKQGMSIHGVRVLGNVERISKIAVNNNVHEILIAIPSAAGAQIRKIVEACRKSKIPYKVLPGISEIIDGKVSVKMLRDVNYEDLLGRQPVKLDIKGISEYMEGKRIMITGCGGSIGAELCRQIMKFNPGYMILLDAGELGLFNIQMEIDHAGAGCGYRLILGNVHDEQLMEDIFQRYRPQIIFHAAAYKHVPMQEKNPWEAVVNNIIGSQTAMDIAVKYCAECFVLVSTDKAVRPTNVMGATKRVAELIMQSRQHTETRLMAVRFGNVVGSSGSVIPLFRAQIEHGGPVTVTHPEVSRYFMTIPEASQLILQAAAMGKGGEIFVLRMGTPVKIADMARDLIRLSGKEPGKGIDIVYTGLREGEKLHEELMTEGEDILPTGHEKIMVLRSNGNGRGDGEQFRQKIDEDLKELLKYTSHHDSMAIKKKLKEMVPEYMPQYGETVL